MKKLKLISTLFVLTLLVTVQLQAQEAQPTESKKFYLKPYGGFIGIQDMTIDFVDQQSVTPVNIKAGFGYTSGISLGYNFTKNISAELGWEYKKNFIEATINDSTYDGDYASNFIYLNAMYRFSTGTRFTPYLGIGGSYIEEVDMDFGSGDSEFSFQKNGQIGVQFLAGLDYAISNRLSMNWELRNNRFSNFDLENDKDMMVTDLKYNPFVVNIGVKVKF